MPRKKKSSSILRFSIWLLIVGFVGFVAFVFWPRHPQNVSSIESWLKADGYQMFRPFRDGVPPGTVLRIEGLGESVAATAEMIGLNTSQVSNGAQVSWDVESELDSLSHANLFPSQVIADAKEAGARTARVSITGVRIREIPLVQLSDAARNNPTLLRLTNDHDDRLVLVTSVLEAGSIRCEFLTRDRAELRLKGRRAPFASQIDSNFHYTSDGALESAVPLMLGYRASALGTQALSLGEAPSLALTLKPLDIDQVARLRARVAQPRSDYQLLVFTIGLGNYAAPLPGARDSATHVGNRLLPYVSSHGGLFGSFASPPDGTPPATKAVILRAIDDFVTQSKSRLSPSKARFVIFYYFGHGVGEGMGHAAFIVPEDYRLHPGEKVIDSADRLVDLGDVLEALKKISPNVIVLMDSCRQHQHEAEQLIQAWKALGQNQGNMGDIMNILQFSSGTVGPSVVFFGSADGTPADVVRVPWSNELVGPLAARIDAMLDVLQRRSAKLSPAEFVDQMQMPIASNPFDETSTKVRGYTPLRSDFRAALPAAPLFDVPSAAGIRDN